MVRGRYGVGLNGAINFSESTNGAVNLQIS